MNAKLFSIKIQREAAILTGPIHHFGFLEKYIVYFLKII